MNTPIYNRILEYKNSNAIRFHMPSHNAETLSPLYQSAHFDITELEWSDNLLFPCGMISDSEQQLRSIYQTEYTMYVTSGTTTSILIALKAMKNIVQNKYVYVDCNCHTSVINALNMFGFNAIYADISLTNVIDFGRNNELGLVIATSPNYYGTVNNDLPEIYSYVSTIGAYLLVDEAHGSHFYYSNLLPDGATKYSDITVNSLHKTMPAFTGASLLHTTRAELVTPLLSARSILHTTSPSYMTLASSEYAISLFSENGEKLYQDTINAINSFIKSTKASLIKCSYFDDITRLTLSSDFISPSVINRVLKQNNIFPEMVSDKGITLIITPYNYRHLNVLSGIINKLTIENNVVDEVDSTPCGMSSVSLFCAYSTDCELILLANAEGRIATQNVGFFPPCTAIIRSGELISRSQIDTLLNSTLQKFNCYNNQIIVYKLEA